MHNRFILPCFFLFLMSGNTSLLAAEQLTLYSTLDTVAIEPLLQQFTQDTGISIKQVSGTAEQMFERLRKEDGDTAADVFIGADVVQLQRAESADLLQAVTSQALEAAVPASYRDAEGYWYGLTMFVRPIFYLKHKVDTYLFYGYEEMARSAWKGRICVSSSDNPYNQSLVASMIASHGKQITQKWLTKFVANLAREPQGDDRDQLIAIGEGVCDIALANSYLYGKLAASKDAKQQQLAAKLGMLWANQPSRGVHANFRGAGVAAHAPHRAGAIKLLEYLVTENSQRWLATHTYEYPVIDMTWTRTHRRWGRFKTDSKNMPRLGELNQTALTLMKEAGWK